MFTNILLRTFCVKLHETLIFFSFLVLSLSLFHVSVPDLKKKNELESTLYSSIIYRRLCKINAYSLLKVCQDTPIKSSGPGYFFFRIFKLKLHLLNNYRYSYYLFHID